MILNSPQSPFLSPSIPLFATNHPHQGQCNSVEEESGREGEGERERGRGRGVGAGEQGIGPPNETRERRRITRYPPGSERGCATTPHCSPLLRKEELGRAERSLHRLPLVFTIRGQDKKRYDEERGPAAGNPAEVDTQNFAQLKTTSKLVGHSG